MKKLITAIIALSMLLTCLSGLAEGVPTAFNKTGIRIDMQKILDSTPNLLDYADAGIIHRDPFVAFMHLDYYALTNDAYSQLTKQFSGASKETLSLASHIVSTCCANIACVITTDAPDADTAIQFVFGELPEGAQILELGEADGYRSFAVLSPVQAPSVNYDDFAEIDVDPQTVRQDQDALLADIENVRATFVDCLKTAELYAPDDPYAGLIGQVISFETTDVDGNPVTSDALFRDNRITMVNLWGTWCVHCVNEMETLVALHTRLREKGCGIVGIEWEKAPIDTMADEIHAFMEEKGINYPSVIMPEDNPIFHGVTGYPTTYFVDSAGRILTYPIVGAMVDQYEPTVERLLAEGAAEATADAGAVKNDGGAYRVIVRDRDGNPVEGAVIQLCDDAVCAFQTTDAEGVATFNVEAQKVYDVHVLQAPEGYAADEGEYTTLDTFSDVNIVLEKAS